MNTSTKIILAALAVFGLVALSRKPAQVLTGTTSLDQQPTDTNGLTKLQKQLNGQTPVNADPSHD